MTELVQDELFVDLPGVLAHASLTLKLEGLNPTGSIKFKTALGLVESLERQGRLEAGDHLIESSSGNLGVALSAVCAQRGYCFTCVVDPNTSEQSTAYMRAMGAEVVTVDERDGNGGFLGNRIRVVEARLRESPDLVWVNQYANDANPEVHARTTARSLLHHLGEVDYLFLGVGTGGTMMGCTRAFRELSPSTTVVAVDSVGSVTFGGEPGPRHIPGLGASRPPELCDPDAPDDVVAVPELDTVKECRDVSRRTGLLVGGSTGTVLSAIRGYSARIPAGSSVVAVSPDLGDRYLTTIYDDVWVEATYGWRPPDAHAAGRVVA